MKTERRLFNEKQKSALLRAQQGRCNICKIPLHKGWHADHITPYSKGGLTDVCNGQALCPKCNLSKGAKLTKIQEISKMSKVVLRDWQEEAKKIAVSAMKAENKHCVLTHATPGGGKTIHALSVYESLIFDKFDKIVVIAPSVMLVSQWAQDAHNVYGLELKNGMLYRDASDFKDYDGIVMTYASVVNYKEDLRSFCNNHRVLVVADEAHHASEKASWGDSFKEAFEVSENILMLTGTPWTSTQTPMPFVEYGEDGRVIADFTYGKASAIAQDVCRATDFHRYSVGKLRFFDPKTQEEEVYNTLEDAIEDGKTGAYSHANKNLAHMKLMFSEADAKLNELRAQTMSTAGGLLIAPDIKTAHKFQDEIYSMTGQEYTIVHSEDSKAHDKIKRFRDSTERWLISVNMVSEGVDIKRLQVCVFMSKAKTELFLRQVIGRIERRRKDVRKEIDLTAFFYYTSHPEVNEIVKNLEEENGIGLKLMNKEEKEKDNNEGDGTRVNENDSYFSDEFKSELEAMVARGQEYPSDIIKKAIELKNSSKHTYDMPLSFLCRIILAQMEKSIENQSVSYQEKTLTIDEKKKKIRTAMNKEIKYKLARAGLMNGDASSTMRQAHYKINKKVGLYKIDDNVSLDDLERRLEYIHESSANEWV